MAAKSVGGHWQPSGQRGDPHAPPPRNCEGRLHKETGQDSEAIGEAVYTLVRNGIAHQFFPNGPIGVMGPRPWEHLTINGLGLVLIDAHTLASDVLGAYSRVVRPLAMGAAEP